MIFSLNIDNGKLPFTQRNKFVNSLCQWRRKLLMVSSIQISHTLLAQKPPAHRMKLKPVLFPKWWWQIVKKVKRSKKKNKQTNKQNKKQRKNKGKKNRKKKRKKMQMESTISTLMFWLESLHYLSRCSVKFENFLASQAKFWGKQPILCISRAFFNIYRH